MNLFPNLKSTYSKEQYSAKEAQQLAHIYSFGPVIFQVARLMIKYGIFEMLSNTKEGLTYEEIEEKTGLSHYAVKCLMEASLTMQTILIEPQTDKFKLAKTGWFLLNDPLIRVDIDFNHDVNYEGWFLLEDALKEGKPAGLKHFGNWPTIYEGLSSLPKDVQKSWFGFDHYYSDNSFDEALNIIFQNNTKTLMDVGGNTGRFASNCVKFNKNVEVTICDLPQQIELMKQHTSNIEGVERIKGIGINLLDATQHFPSNINFDAIWMSQFLDCFGEDEIVSILSRATEVMTTDSRLYIMETLWDRQKYTSAAFCLTQISLYFTALANGNSKMYNTDDMLNCIEKANLTVECIHDNIGLGGHSIIVCKLK